jgi:hypothetical protein
LWIDGRKPQPVPHGNTTRETFLEVGEIFLFSFNQVQQNMTPTLKSLKIHQWPIAFDAPNTPLFCFVSRQFFPSTSGSLGRFLKTFFTCRARCKDFIFSVSPFSCVASGFLGPTF